jgi:hypothetical protein
LDVNGSGTIRGELAAILPSVVGSITARNSSTTAAELHIRPNSGKSGWLSFTEDSVADRWVLGTAAGNGSLIFGTGNPSGYTERARITSDGNVGIGTTSPGTKLHVVGSYTLQNGDMSVTQNYGITWNNGDNYIKGISGYHLQFTTYDGVSAQQEVMRLTGGSSGSGGGRVGIGNTAPTDKLSINGNVYVSGTLTEASSISLKENIDPITGALSLILGINGYTYDRKDGSRKQEPGLIAEEVEQVLPNIVQKDDEGNPTGIQYTKIIAYLVESIKELKAEIDTLKGK